MSSLDPDPPIRLADRRRPAVRPPGGTRVEDRRGDADLLALVVDGDAEALDRLCERHAGTVLAVARRVLWDRALAEEVTQGSCSCCGRRPGCSTRGGRRSASGSSR